MLLTENIALRYREWLDRGNPEPDLVPRLRRVWMAPAVEPDSPRQERLEHVDLGLRSQPALEAPPGA